MSSSSLLLSKFEFDSKSRLSTLSCVIRALALMLNIVLLFAYDTLGCPAHSQYISQWVPYEKVKLQTSQVLVTFVVVTPRCSLVLFCSFTLQSCLFVVFVVVVVSPFEYCRAR